ncbi:response regulator [Sphingomonas adhaesiva]|uniref:response regulator n=1 Tax=Sphingomonas adhaesiva TaxID=28212 RepID=UPI002FF65C25
MIADTDATARDRAARVLADHDWVVAAVADGTGAIAAMSPCPALVLLDMRVQAPSALDTIATIRRLPGPAATAPVIALTTTRPTGPSVLLSLGFDAVLPRPFTVDELARVAAHWHPGVEHRSLDRLERSFGAAQIASMIARLRDLFATAVAALDGDEVRDLAHRIAGVAGTLGFTATGQAWRALSERDGGDPAVRATARREARRAIALIDRRLAENAATPST